MIIVNTFYFDKNLLRLQILIFSCGKYCAVLLDNVRWQRAILSHVHLMEVSPCQKFALPVKDQNRLGSNKNGPSKRSKRSKMIHRQKWNLSVK